MRIPSANPKQKFEIVLFKNGVQIKTEYRYSGYACKASCCSLERRVRRSSHCRDQAAKGESSMSTWNVYIHSRNVGYIGTVTEDTEELARCAAISKFGIADDDEFVEVQEGVDGPIGIIVTDEFDVRRAT